MDHLQLGKHTEYISVYTPSLLDPIPRSLARESLAIDQQQLPFAGVDIWTAYEVSWLNHNGLPQQAIAVFAIPADSPNIIESKSFKLYLNSFNQTRFNNRSEVLATLESDLKVAAGVPVLVDLEGLDQFAATGVQRPRGSCIDQQEVKITDYQPNANLLNTLEEERSETLYSDLLKSNCPVTAQPDWATLIVSYSGKQICAEGLLRYVVSFRDHQDFHENCVERIYCDIMERCQPSSLMVYARYTRRGGLDINPLRHSLNEAHDALEIASRLVRQ
ncbi:NADPH-dependent 7-cyano-7-deazaguanine reductase QueF [uncultured Pseudoteredinibacter sp.]|uniref:NADPH-dependent 7-cyano-7-deazaguanine reductase QueF n=1 Tax=uncultured Pseudoteredinibacter sp. TaxID=1641701 RepID=UPI0026137692|nr:NADPH-dependent 7-cyano-7-deazaguanine reductase QueF [uncultured Pseudoteredinibacter sp.]